MGLVVFGVDPGFAGQGIVVLEQEEPIATPRVLFASSTKTEKRAGKRRKDLRVSADDQRRFKELWEGLEFAYGKIQSVTPNAMCIEVYAPYKEATSAAAKAGAAYGGATYWGLGKGMAIIPAVPQDIKRGVCGRLGASKKDVQDAIVKLVPDLGPLLAKLNKGDREHMADACAHAYIGLKDLWELRKMVTTTSNPQQMAF